MSNDRHILDLLTLEKELNTDLYEGLSSREAKSRLDKESKKGGANRSLFVQERRNRLSLLTTFHVSPFSVLLLIMSLLTAIFGRPVLGLSVFAMVLLATVFGGIASLRANKQLEDAREYASPMVRVRRGGNNFYTDGRNIVKGDVIILGEGDLLPCDVRLIKCKDLEVDELYPNDGSIQRRRVRKNAEAVYSEDDNVDAFGADNMVYGGSAVMGGRAVALVVETGASVALSKSVPAGALGGRENDYETLQKIRPSIYKISFYCASGLLLLSLISLLTLRGKETFICTFTMLLSAFFLIGTELLRVGADEIFSSFITRLSKSRTVKDKKDNSAVVRNVRTLASLSKVTDLVLLGSAGICAGTFKLIDSFYGGSAKGTLSADDEEGLRLLDLIHTYVKAKTESEADRLRGSDGVTDALYDHLRQCGYDASGASLAIRSLYLAKDAKDGYSYACVETDVGFYRTALIDNVKALANCKQIRENNVVRPITDEDIKAVVAFCKNAVDHSAKYLLCISEADDITVFEGAISLMQPIDENLVPVIGEMQKFGIRVTVCLPREDEGCGKMLSASGLSELFEGKIVYSSVAKKNNRSISGLSDAFRVFVGFDADEISAMISEMKQKGSKVAAYCVDNGLNPVMAKADVAISCDVLKYSSDKHREAVYERMPSEGKDISLRASQQTRLLSRVIVKRAHGNGGGISSVFKAIKMSRGAYVTFGQSMLLFALLMSSLLAFSIMSVITGNVLLDPLQTVSLSAVFAFLSVYVFNESEQLASVTSQKIDFVSYPRDLIRKRYPEMIARASLAAIVGITVKILDAFGIFGDKPNYTLPIFICMCLTVFAEVFLINRSFTKKGEGRGYCWLKVIVAYAILLIVCYISTQKPFADEFLSNGIGSREYLIVPAYVVLYCIMILCCYLFAKKRKN